MRLMVLSLPDELPSGVAAVLSAAEIDVATGLLRGEPYASMARRRGTSDRTIAKQVRAIFKKLQVRSRSELVRKVRLDG